MEREKIRESVIAGTWYPGKPEALRREILGHLARARVEPLNGRLVGLVAPHAGYLYSGGVAAHAYKLLEQHPFDRVLIMAPSHRAYFTGASIYHLGGYRTPLGVVPLDREIVDSLRKHSDLFGYVPQAHAQEHSLEIQLPFLQVVLGDFRLTPVLLGDLSEGAARLTAKAVAEACAGRNILLVASTDLSHYHPYEQAVRLDRRVLDRVEAFDPEGLAEELRSGRCEACGAWPLTVVMWTAKELGASKGRVLHYANSGDVTGDTRSVVGYMAAALVDNPGQGREVNRRHQPVGVDLGLSQEEKETLRDIAWEAIRNRIRNVYRPVPKPDASKLQEPRGVFVSLHRKGCLRGCIGLIEGREPLYQAVAQMAVQAAFGDPRFPPLQPDELDDLDLEISVLTPLQRIHDPSEIVVGVHGVMVRRGHRSGLLLPQVAVEHGWSREELLEWTCRKAGLPPDAWKDPRTEIFVFSADVF
jgi:hypothetical protein